jgi:ribosomal protein S18 acetylase RimI-like enzyme
MNEAFSIQPAAGEDRAFLVEMLALTLQTQPEFVLKSSLERQGLAQFEIAGWQPERDFAFIARLGRQRAGAVWLHSGGEIGATVFTLGIGVLPRFQGQQVGTRLMEYALTFCGQRHGLTLNLKVHPTNEGAIRFYRRFGFEPAMLEMKKRLQA